MSRWRSRPEVLDRAVAAATALAIVLIARDGGSFDLVVRQGWSTFLWWGLALAVLVGVAFRLRLHATGFVPLAAMAALVGWTVLSLGWTANDELTTTELARNATYLGVIVAVVGLAPARRWHAVVAGAALGAVAICAWAMAQRLWPDGFDATVSIFPGDSRRLSAPFGYWNAVGAWAGMSAALCLGWSAHARSLVWRGLAGAAVPLTIVVAYLTYSRAAVGGTAFGLLVLIAFSRNRATLAAVIGAAAVTAGGTVLLIRGRPEVADATGGAGGGTVLLALLGAALVTGLVAVGATRLGADRLRLGRRATRIVVPVGAVLAVAGVAVLATTVGPKAWDQFTTTAKEEGTADPAARLTDLNGARYDHWKVAYDSFKEEPWKGSGAGTYEYAWNQDGFGYVRDAHSLYFESLAELGIPGLTLVLLFIIGVILALARAISALEHPGYRGVLAGAAGAIGAYLLGAGVDWLWESPGVTVFALVLVGALILAGARPAPPQRWPWRIPLALVALVLCAVQLPGLVSTSEVRKSQDALAAGDVAAARERADNAIDAQPWASSPLVQRALVDERVGAYDAAAAELRAAARRAPLDWRIQLLLARVEARRGNADAALAALRRARVLRPKSQFFLAG